MIRNSKAMHLGKKFLSATFYAIVDFEASWMSFLELILHVIMIDPEVHPQHEEYWGHVNPIGPRACYDEGKRVAETMCYAYHKQVGYFY